MKRTLFIAAIIFLFSNTGFSQPVFGVSPGLSLNSAYFGYKVNRFVPFIGFQYFGTSINYEYKHKLYDGSLGSIVDHNHSDDVKIKLIIPNIGLKYYVKESGNLKAFVTLNLSKPILTGKYEVDGIEDEESKKYIEGISLFGGELSFGAEYFFDEQFSIGGEFGLRYLHAKYTFSEDESIFNPNTGDTEVSKASYEAKLNASPTFSRISLNFYF